MENISLRVQKKRRHFLVQSNILNLGSDYIMSQYSVRCKNLDRSFPRNEGDGENALKSAPTSTFSAQFLELDTLNCTLHWARDRTRPESLAPICSHSWRRQWSTDSCCFPGLVRATLGIHLFLCLSYDRFSVTSFSFIQTSLGPIWGFIVFGGVSFGVSLGFLLEFLWCSFGIPS